MAFLLRAISGSNNSSREKIKDVEDVNKTFQAELDNIRSCLDVEDDEIQLLMEMIFDSCFPESQRFLKYPTREQLKFHKDTVLRLLSALSFQDVPVANVLLRVVHKHGTEVVSETLLTLLELVQPLLAMKDVMEFHTNEDTSDVAGENQWYSSFRSSPDSAGSDAQSLHLNVLESPRISASKSPSPQSPSFQLDSFNKMDSSPVTFRTPPLDEVPFRFPESKWEQANVALQRTSSPSVLAGFKLPDSELFTSSSSSSSSNNSSIAMISSSDSVPNPLLLENSFETFSIQTSRHFANASNLQLGGYSNGDRLFLPWLWNKTGDGSKEFRHGFSMPTTHYSQTRKLLPLEEENEEEEEDELGPSVLRDSNVKWKEQNGHACLKALHLQNAATTEDLTEFMAPDSRNSIGIGLHQEQGSKLSDEQEEFEELNQIHLRSPAATADLNNMDLKSIVSSWGHVPAGAGAAMNGFRLRDAAQAVSLGKHSEENGYSSDSELEEVSFSSDESSLDVEVSDNEGDDDLWDVPEHDEHGPDALLHSKQDPSSPHLQRSFSAPLLRSYIESQNDRDKENFRTQSLPSLPSAQKDYTLLAIEVVDDETADVKADQTSDQSVFDNTLLPKDLHLGEDNRIMERDTFAPPHGINISNHFLCQADSTAACAVGLHTTTTSGNSELEMCCEDLLCSEDLSLVGCGQQEAVIAIDYVTCMSQYAEGPTLYSLADSSSELSKGHLLGSDKLLSSAATSNRLNRVLPRYGSPTMEVYQFEYPEGADAPPLQEFAGVVQGDSVQQEEGKGNDTSHVSYKTKLSNVPVLQIGESVRSGIQGEEETQMPIIAADQPLHSPMALEVVENPLAADWEATNKDPPAGLNLEEEKSHQRASVDKPTAASENDAANLAAAWDAELIDTVTTAAVSLDNTSKKQFESMTGRLEPDKTDEVLVPTTDPKVSGQYTPENNHQQDEEEVQAHMQELSEASDHFSQIFYAHNDCNQCSLSELQITQAGDPQACNLLELSENHAGETVATNAAFGNKIMALNPILLTGNNSHRRIDSIASLRSFPIPMGRTKVSLSPKGTSEKWTYFCCFSTPSTS